MWDVITAIIDRKHRLREGAENAIEDHLSLVITNQDGQSNHPQIFGLFRSIILPYIQ